VSAPKRSTLEEARDAKSEALAVFSKFGEVMGVGITRVDEGYAVKVNLKAPPADWTKLPPDVKGVPVRVEVVGTIR